MHTNKHNIDKYADRPLNTAVGDMVGLFVGSTDVGAVVVVKGDEQLIDFK